MRSIWCNITAHYAVCTNDRSVSNVNAGENHRILPNPNIIFDNSISF